MSLAILGAAPGVVGINGVGVLLAPPSIRVGMAASAPALDAAEIQPRPEIFEWKPLSATATPTHLRQIVASVYLAVFWRGVRRPSDPFAPYPPSCRCSAGTERDSCRFSSFRLEISA
jgi:hypothetical protein